MEGPKDNIASAFGDHFIKKVKNITETTIINPQVHNGHQKITLDIDQPITELDIMGCVKSLKIKNCEGYDRIPQRILSEGINHLLN